MRKRNEKKGAAEGDAPTVKGSYESDDDGELESSSLVCRLLLGFIAIVVSILI